jgi:23S rRNA pseudouridine2605 synthase
MPGPKVRLQRLMADAGVAARRVCEQLIEQGHVRVNGEVVKTLPVFVDPEEDSISVDGRPLPRPQRRLYLMLHKPSGTIVSTADEPELGRATVMDLIDHPSAPRLFPVGRLEYDTTGLLILTNDGSLANRLTHPRYRVPKTYHAVVRGVVDVAGVEALRTKIRAMAEREAGVRVQAPAIAIVRREPDRTLLELTMEEGPTRHLREAFEFLGMPIKKLTRVAVGGLQLKGLALGRWRELSRDEVSMLRKGGGKAAEKAGGGGSPGPRRRRSGQKPAAGNAVREMRAPRPARNARPTDRPSRDPRDNRPTRSRRLGQAPREGARPAARKAPRRGPR